ncbi:MAG: SAM-dependent methyltransferase TehB [Moraxellaceae bacterium]|nr:MAG: SAM-dependent methyltransferase TehB [Moraxellaceae bacterium]
MDKENITSSLLCYKQMPVWTKATLPKLFQQQHNTKAGTWAQLHIFKGSLKFALLTEQGDILSSHDFSVQQQPTRIEPQAWHKIVSASDDLECQLSFYCQPEQYFAKKYQLSPTHSEVIAALPYVQASDNHPLTALDVGCGSGRNALYLAQQGFTVDACDVNVQAIDKLKEIIAAEHIQTINATVCDLNQPAQAAAQFTACYDFVYSTVVMMFLQPATIATLIAQMQQATRLHGHNLIVCAMDTADYPVQPDFPFSFKPDELSQYYAGWKIIKYNENVGELHRVDAQGQRIKQRFATLLAQKISDSHPTDPIAG